MICNKNKQKTLKLCACNLGCAVKTFHFGRGWGVGGREGVQEQKRGKVYKIMEIPYKIQGILNQMNSMGN